LESPGSFIKRERELRAITLDEIAEETKIAKRILTALERDDYESLPAPTFIKGFLRAYSNYVGLDGNDVVLRYEDFTERTKKEHETEDEETETQSVNRRYYLTAIVVSVLFLLLLLTLYLLWPDNSKRTEQGEKGQEVVQPTEKKEEDSTITETLSGKVPENETTKAENEPSFQAKASGETSEEKQTVSFSASEETWILIVIDDEKIAEVLLKPGEHIEWEGKKRFQVTIGNVGGVKATFNGNPLDLSDQKGKVVKLTLPPESM
jgi:cytoskeleton protein RodZ